MNTILVLVNHRKLFGKKKALFEDVIEGLRRLNHKINIEHYTADIEIKEVAEKYALNDNLRQIVVAGGDGSVNRLLQFWLRRDIPLAIIPLGTCNMFAKECGYKKEAAQIIQIIHQNHRKAFYTGVANDLVFATTVGCGIDGNLCASINWKMKRYFGKLYLSFLVAKEILRKRKPIFNVMIDNSKVFESTFVVIAKGKYYAGNFHLTRKPSLFNPQLFAFFFKSESAWDDVCLFLRMVTNTMDRSKITKVIPADRIEILSAEQLPVQVDGDVRFTTPVNIVIDKNPRYVCVPQINEP